MTEVRVRVRPASPTPAPAPVRTRTRPTAPTVEKPKPIFGMRITCGQCRGEAAFGKLIGVCQKTKKGYTAYAYKGEGSEHAPDSFLSPTFFDDWSQAFDYVSRKHACTPVAKPGRKTRVQRAAPKPAKPAWATGQDLSKVRVRTRVSKPS